MGKYGPGLRNFVSSLTVPVQIQIPFDSIFDLFAGQKHRGVILIAHKSAYL